MHLKCLMGKSPRPDIVLFSSVLHQACGLSKGQVQTGKAAEIHQETPTRAGRLREKPSLVIHAIFLYVTKSFHNSVQTEPQDSTSMIFWWRTIHRGIPKCRQAFWTQALTAEWISTGTRGNGFHFSHRTPKHRATPLPTVILKWSFPNPRAGRKTTAVLHAFLDPCYLFMFPHVCPVFSWRCFFNVVYRSVGLNPRWSITVFSNASQCEILIWVSPIASIRTKITGQSSESIGLFCPCCSYW